MGIIQISQDLSIAHRFLKKDGQSNEFKYSLKRLSIYIGR